MSSKKTHMQSFYNDKAAYCQNSIFALFSLGSNDFLSQDGKEKRFFVAIPCNLENGNQMDMKSPFGDIFHFWLCSLELIREDEIIEREVMENEVTEDNYMTMGEINELIVRSKQVRQKIEKCARPKKIDITQSRQIITALIEEIGLKKDVWVDFDRNNLQGGYEMINDKNIKSYVFETGNYYMSMTYLHEDAIFERNNLLIRCIQINNKKYSIESELIEKDIFDENKDRDLPEWEEDMKDEEINTFQIFLMRSSRFLYAVALPVGILILVPTHIIGDLFRNWGIGKLLAIFMGINIVVITLYFCLLHLIFIPFHLAMLDWGKIGISTFYIITCAFLAWHIIYLLFPKFMDEKSKLF